MIHWKNLSHEVADAHRQTGEALVPLGQVDDNLTHLVTLYIEPRHGRQLRERQDIRRWLYTIRKSCLFQRVTNVFVWTHYSEEFDVTFMGMCMAMTEEKAFRFLKRDPIRYAVTEVAA